MLGAGCGSGPEHFLQHLFAAVSWRSCHLWRQHRRQRAGELQHRMPRAIGWLAGSSTAELGSTGRVPPVYTGDPAAVHAPSEKLPGSDAVAGPPRL